MPTDETGFAEPFGEMAERIRRIDQAEFGGAVVIVPPQGGRIAFVVTDPSPDLAHFWSGVQARVEAAMTEARQEEIARSQGFGIRR